MLTISLAGSVLLPALGNVGIFPLVVLFPVEDEILCGRGLVCHTSQYHENH